KLRGDWLRASPGIPLDFVDCPDRRLAAAAANLASAEAALPGVGVTAILPRRSFTPVVGRLLHDRTADKMAAAISRIPHAAATIVPFDVRSRVESLSSKGLAAKPAAVANSATAVGAEGERPAAAAVVAPERADEPIAEEVTAPAASGR